MPASHELADAARHGGTTAAGDYYLMPFVRSGVIATLENGMAQIHKPALPLEDNRQEPLAFIVIAGPAPAGLTDLPQRRLRKRPPPRIKEHLPGDTDPFA